jgi:hypothetical protein
MGAVTMASTSPASASATARAPPRPRCAPPRRRRQPATRRPRHVVGPSGGAPRDPPGRTRPPRRLRVVQGGLGHFGADPAGVAQRHGDRGLFRHPHASSSCVRSSRSTRYRSRACLLRGALSRRAPAAPPPACGPGSAPSPAFPPPPRRRGGPAAPPASTAPASHAALASLRLLVRQSRCSARPPAAALAGRVPDTAHCRMTYVVRRSSVSTLLHLFCCCTRSRTWSATSESCVGAPRLPRR